MTIKTFIPGKQSALEDSIAKMEGLLSSLGFQIQSNPVLNPVESIYSQHIYDARCPGLFTNGKGACEKACYASALGEFLERLSTNYFFSDYYLTPASNESSDGEDWLYYPDEKSLPAGEFQSCMPEGLWEFYNQALDGFKANFEFEDFLSLNENAAKVRGIPLNSVKTGQTAYFPMNLLSNLYASNGLSAGNTALEAQIQGLSEIFERWVKNKIFQENLCLPEVPDSVLSQFVSVKKSIQALSALGLKVSVRDASLGGRYPVINVTLIDPASGRCFASFGAHPIFEVALERTLTESLQGRHLQSLEGFQIPVNDPYLVADAENLENHFIDSSGFIHSRFLSQESDFEFQAWRDEVDMTGQWQQLCELVWEQGTDIWMAHYRQYGFESVRMVVPGMSEVYPLDELLENNQNQGRILRSALLALSTDLSSHQRNQAIRHLLEVLERIGFSDHQGVANLIGLMPDAHSFWAQLNVAQLRFWSWVALGDWQLAYDQALEMRGFLQPNQWSAWVDAYCFVFELFEEAGCSLDQWETLLNSGGLSSFETIFSDKIVQSVAQHIRGESLFAQAPLGKQIFLESESHTKLVQIYQSLRTAKTC